MMANKTIVISLPARLSDYTIIKDIRLDDYPSIQIDITDNTSCADATSDDCLFFCNQHKQKIVFNPFEYAYIESTSNHYSQWHPINPNKPIFSKYTRSLGELHSKLRAAGIYCFWRVHDSYLVNCRCAKSLVNDKILLKELQKAIPIGKEYKADFLRRVVIF